MSKTFIYFKYLIWAYFSLFTFGLIENSRGPIYPEILNDFSINTVYGSHIFSISSVAGLLITLTAKHWLKQFGVNKSLRFFLLFQAIGCFGMGLSGALQSYPLILLSSFIFGLSSGGIGITCNLMISYGISDNYRRKAYSGFHAMYGIASLMAPFLLSLSLKLNHNWTVYLQAISIIPIFVIIYSFFTHSPPSIDTEVHSDMIIKKSTIIKVCLIFALHVAAEISISSRLVFYLRSGLNFEQELAGTYFGGFFILLLGGRVLFSILNFKFDSYKGLFYSSIGTLILYIIGLIYHPIFLTLCGLTISIFFPCAMDRLCSEFKGAKERMLPPAMTSITIFIILMHWGIGQLSNSVGIKYALFIGPCFLITALIILVNNKLSNN